MENKINWYPGHMKKAADNVLKILPVVDMVIEIIDSRCIKSSSNDDLKNIIKNKKIIKIALKKDLCDIDEKKYNDILFISTKNKNDKKVVINYLNNQVKEKMDSLKRKGMLKPQFTILVVGLPNVGKSSFINFLSQKNTLLAQNKAGVTKKQVNRKINDNFWMVDNPGIFVKNIKDKNIGFKLALINSINKNILPIYEINCYFHSFMQEKYWDKYSNFFNIKEKISYDKLVELIGYQMNFKIKNDELDYDKINNYLFNIYSNAKICRYHFEE